MENKNYNALTEEFFNEFDARTHKAILTNKIFSCIKPASLLLATGSFLLESTTGSEVFGVISLISVVLFLIGFIGKKKTKEKVKSLIELENDRFYDEVYIKMVASELDADAVSVSFTNTDFRKATAAPGDVLDSRNVLITGTYNGCPYSIANSRNTIVTETLYNEKTGVTVSYVPLLREGPFVCEYATRRDIGENTVDILKPKEDMLELYGFDLTTQNPVKMDNKNFRFQVRCDETVSAYKFLTADVMESITNFSKKTDVRGISVTGSNMKLMTFDKVINLRYSPRLKKSLKRNLRNLTADKVLKEASEDVKKIRSFLENMPAAATVHA